jgi:hypothetical protein
VEGVAFALAAALVGLVLQRVSAHAALRLAVGLFGAGSLLYPFVWKTSVRQAEIAVESIPWSGQVHSREVGRAIAAQTPKKSLLMLDVERPIPNQIEHHNLMFWSNRLVHYGRVPPPEYAQAGYQTWLVSPAAEPFAPLEVPAWAWLRAYDLSKPLTGPTPVPAGLHPLEGRAGNLVLLGWASGPHDRRGDHYAFIVRAEGGSPGPLTVTFHTDAAQPPQVIQPDAGLRNRDRLQGVDWFLIPAVGPRRADLRQIEFGPAPGLKFSVP